MYEIIAHGQLFSAGHDFYIYIYNLHIWPGEILECVNHGYPNRRPQGRLTQPCSLRVGYPWFTHSSIYPGHICKLFI